MTDFLGLLRSGDDQNHAEAAPQPATAAQVVPADPQPGFVAQITGRARREIAARPGSLRHEWRHGTLETRDQHRAYVRSRVWAKGPWSEWEGRIFYALIGRPGHNVAHLLGRIFERQYRLWVAVIVVLPVLSLVDWLLTTVLRLVLGLG
jgi:hypothetical protein